MATVTVAAEFNRGGFAFIRIGQREVHIERHPAASREDWLTVERSSYGGAEVIWNVGRWAVHFVRHSAT